ncbi:CD80-like immunoglobulin C2-set [Trinorchestia longiramus]|nr:CD80-like immunoglobulin C2-set [Trinorchestia longiramus]
MRDKRKDWFCCSRKAQFLLSILLMFTFSAVADGTQVVQGVAGGTAELPCQLAPPDPHDRAVLALWYKQGRRLPVYSYDARGESGTHQPNNEVLGGRGTFLTIGAPARLVLSPVTSADQGIYTCRVDYITSPTHNTMVNLSVIEPPERLDVYTGQNELVAGDMVGPVSEGAPLHIYCLVKGGRPQPSVSWWSDGAKLTTKSQVLRSGDIRSDLEIPEISRSYESKSFSCEAHNNKQTPPLNKKLGIVMNLRPLSAKIKLPPGLMVAGNRYTFTCECHGSKPSSVITWQLDSRDIDPTRSRTHSPSEDVTTGTLSLLLDAVDNKKVLHCQAHNPNIPGSTISDTVKLDIQYAPIVSLQLGSNLDPGQIKQGDDVYFECLVDANPPPYKIAWYRNAPQHEHGSRARLALDLGGPSLLDSFPGDRVSA